MVNLVGVLLRFRERRVALCANIFKMFNNFYVDNSIVSFDTVEEAVQCAETVTRALRSGGFVLSQWDSSSTTVLRPLPGKPIAAVDLDLDGLPTEKILGLFLDFSSDSFVPNASAPSSCKTRRQIVQAAAVWNKWAASLPALNALRIPICYCAYPYDANAVDLIVFSDGSEKAFGAIGYLRFELTPHLDPSRHLVH